MIIQFIILQKKLREFKAAIVCNSAYQIMCLLLFKMSYDAN